MNSNYRSCIEDLNDLGWNELIEMYSNSESVPVKFRDDRNLWCFEVAYRIAGFGAAGINFLVEKSVDADEIHLRAILSALAWNKEQYPIVEAVAFRYLNDVRPLIVAEAIDLLGLLKYRNYKDIIVPFLSSPSPYVVGAVLRYVSQLFPDEAKPLLIEALRSDEPIVIQNAIDELDEMNAVETLPMIAPFQEHEDKNVRAAAIWAVTRPRYDDRLTG